MLCVKADMTVSKADRLIIHVTDDFALTVDKVIDLTVKNVTELLEVILEFLFNVGHLSMPS